MLRIRKADRCLYDGFVRAWSFSFIAHMGFLFYAADNGVRLVGSSSVWLAFLFYACVVFFLFLCIGGWDLLIGWIVFTVLSSLRYYPSVGVSFVFLVSFCQLWI